MRAAIWTIGLSVWLVALALPVAADDTSSLADGLVAHWSFDAAADSEMVDVSGNGLDGALYGATRTTGVVGNALEFDGDDEAWVPALDVSPPAAITDLTVGSIAMWLRYEDSDQEAEPLFYLGNPDRVEMPGFTIEVGHPSNNKLYFTFFIGSRPDLCFDSNAQLEPGVWYHFVGVVGDDYNTGYLNGIEMTDRNYNAGGPEDSMFFADLPGIDRLSLGSGLYYQSQMLFGNGAVDEVRIYDRPLTAAEALALYSNTDPPENSAPVAADDAATTTANSTLVVDVLANDTDPDGDALHVAAVANPENGTATTDGADVVYTPDPDWFGTDVVLYWAGDPYGAVDAAVAKITVVEAGATLPPAAPESLSAAATEVGVVVLNWSDMSSGASQETHFELQRSNRTDRSPWQTIAEVSADEESFNDDTVTTGTRYAYRLRAVNDVDASPWSNRVQVKAA